MLMFKPLVLYTALLLPILIFEIKSIRKPFLIDYISFNSYFSFFNSLLEIFFIIVFLIYCFGLGNNLAKKFAFNFPTNFKIGLGLIFINLLLIPLFFLNLFKIEILLLLFFLLSWPATYRLEKSFNLNNLKIGLTKSHFLLITYFLFFLSVVVSFLDALMPVNFLESSGDIANHYLRIPMAFAKAGGVVHNSLLAGSLAGSLNYELISSFLVVLSNPQIIKILGFVLFLTTFFIILEIGQKFLKTTYSLGVALIFLITPFFIDKDHFSFVHPRVYIMFLSTFSLGLICLGYQYRQTKYFWLSLLSLGLLSATNYQGLSLGLIGFILLVPGLWHFKKNWKIHLFFISIFIVLILIFPFWTWFNQDSPFPKSPFLNSLFGFAPKSEMSSAWVAERVLLQQVTTNRMTFISFAGFLCKLLFSHLNFLIILLFLGFSLKPNLPSLLFFSFYFANTLLMSFIFSSSTTSLVNARFQHIGLPWLLLALLALINIVEEKLNAIWKGKIKNYLQSSIIRKMQLFLQQLKIFRIFINNLYFFTMISLRLVFIFSLVYLFTYEWKIRYLILNFFPEIIIVLFFIQLKIFYLFFYKHRFYQKIAWKLLIINNLFCILTLFLISKLHLLFKIHIIENFFKNGLGLLEWLMIWMFFTIFDYFLIKPSKRKRGIIVLKFNKFFKLSIGKYLIGGILLFSLSSFTFQAVAVLTKPKYSFSRRLAYITKKINLNDYLYSRKVNISEYLNSRFTSEIKILYFFHASGIYIKPQLYQASSTSVVSVIYDNDVQRAMKTLKKEGINFLIVDNQWSVTANNPFLSLVADITTPIFEPDFLSKHFILQETNIPQFYVFEINYEGIEDKEEIVKNFEKITQAGFFRFINDALVNNNKEVIKIKSNSYLTSSLLEKYQQIKDKIYPPSLYVCINYNNEVLNEFARNYTSSLFVY